jgi:membrane fusion protein, multidrug efflux system
MNTPAQANLTLAQTNSARSQQLFQDHVNSQKELDTVLATEQVQKASRDNAAAALTSAQDMKACEQIRAPFAGTITARYTDVGSLVAAGSARTVQKLFDLAQSDPVRVFVNVPQADVSSVKSGTPATITVDEFPGSRPGEMAVKLCLAAGTSGRVRWPARLRPASCARPPCLCLRYRRLCRDRQRCG